MTTVHSRWRGAAGLLAVLAVSGLVAACGRSSSSSSTASSSKGTLAAVASGGIGSSASRTSLRNCLKAHGVTLRTRRSGTGTTPRGTRPPGWGLGFLARGGRGRFAKNPKLAAAFRACGGARLKPGRRFARPSPAAITSFVSCVRRHGYDIPNPNLSGSGPVLPAGIRTSPKFVAAAKACLSHLRPARRTGAPPADSAAPSRSS